MKRVLIALALLLSVVGQAAAAPLPYNINNWYWVASDQNPATQVFSSASGTFVNDNDTTYQTWLANGTENAVAILGAANNGSGLVRLTLAGASNYTTGQSWNVAGTGLYDQNWTITTVDATHLDLQSSTFTSGVTSGTFSGASFGPNKAGINATIDTFNQTLPRPGYVVNASTTLANPIPWFVDSGEASPIALPKANVPGAVPLGRPFLFFNDTSSTVPITDFGGGALTTLQSGAIAAITLIANTNNAGTWSIQYLSLPASSYPQTLGGFAKNINCNATGDTAIPIIAGTTNYQVVTLLWQGVSGAWGTAQAALYTSPSQGGTDLTSGGQTVIPVTSAGVATAGALVPMTLISNFFVNSTTLYINVGTVQSAACRVNAYIMIRPLP